MRWTERQRAMLREMGVVLPPVPLVLQARAAAPVTTVERIQTVAPVEKPAVPDAVEWLIVGEPFDAVDAVGAAGAVEGDAERLLDNMLRAIGVTRASAGANPAASTGPSRRARFFPLADRSAWQAAVSPSTRCILVLGRAAAETVLGIDQPIGSLRGRVHAWQGTPVVVTFAPAYLLRHPADKARAWADLCLAVGAAEGERPIETAPASASA